jgi:hypothetical protein
MILLIAFGGASSVGVVCFSLPQQSALVQQIRNQDGNSFWMYQ